MDGSFLAVASLLCVVGCADDATPDARIVLGVDAGVYKVVRTLSRDEGVAKIVIGRAVDSSEESVFAFGLGLAGGNTTSSLIEVTATAERVWATGESFVSMDVGPGAICWASYFGPQAASCVSRSDRADPPAILRYGIRAITAAGILEAKIPPTWYDGQAIYLDVNQPVPTLELFGGFPSRVARSGGVLFGLTPAGIVRAGGSGPPQTLPGSADATSMAFDLSYAYWAIRSLGLVRRSTQDGFEPTTLFTNQAGIEELVMSGPYLAWSTFPSGTAKAQLVVADTASGRLAKIPVSDSFGTHHTVYALGDGDVYWIDLDAQKHYAIVKMPLANLRFDGSVPMLQRDGDELGRRP